MAVVRVDLLKAMLLGARQVERVTGAEEDTAEAVGAIGDFADSIRARLIEVALGDVTPRRSRSPILAQFGLIHGGIDRDL